MNLDCFALVLTLQVIVLDAVVILNFGTLTMYSGFITYASIYFTTRTYATPFLGDRVEKEGSTREKKTSS